MLKYISTLTLTRATPSYVPVINSLRGLASLLVCMFHLVCLPLNFLQDTLAFDLAPYGKYGVQIFFIITGIVIPMALINGKYNYSSFGKFMLKRIVRIEPPYLFSILASILFVLLRSYFSAKTDLNIPSAKSLLLHVGYLIPFVKGQHWFIIVFWTMAVEFQFYLIISLIFPLLVSSRLIYRVISYCLIFASAVIFRNGEFAPVWLPVFLVGIIYISFLFGKIKRPEFYTVVITCVCFILALHGIAITVISVATLNVIYFFTSYKNKISSFFGNISYSLYLTHTIFGTAAINLFVPHVTSVYQKTGLVLLGFVISVAVAYVFFMLIERPFKIYASKILMNKKAMEVSITRNLPGEVLIRERA